jgi:dephospho-CoA kinase
MEKKVIVIGLTGGIASGKSSVCAELQRLGAHIIDADKLGKHSLTSFSVLLLRQYAP